MVFEEKIFYIREPLLYRGRLSNNVNAVCFIDKHILEAAHLSFDYFKTAHEASVVFLRNIFSLHTAMIPPRGYMSIDPILRLLINQNPEKKRSEYSVDAKRYK